LDGRNRPPYFLATTESARNAFRTVRAKIPDAWDWDACKVGPPLTDDDLKRKKEKASEKKRRQREKQKERKAAEEAELQEAKRKEETLAKEEEAKRTRAGLQPKVASSKPGEYSCDFCQKKCKRKSQMFQRLDFYYCSTECVKRHQRELMAAAATARLGK
jgi:flagellar biosynthesis GTPase FlhF